MSVVVPLREERCPPSPARSSVSGRRNKGRGKTREGKTRGNSLSNRTGTLSEESVIKEHKDCLRELRPEPLLSGSL